MIQNNDESLSCEVVKSPVGSCVMLHQTPAVWTCQTLTNHGDFSTI